MHIAKHIGYTAPAALCAALALAGAIPRSAFAETDVCGNEITTYTEDGVSKTYTFIVSGDPRPYVGTAAASAASHNMASAGDTGLIAVFKSVLASIGGALRSVPWVGTSILFK